MEPLAGIHHITAVTGNAAANVAFYTDVMGMRLVKKTVNQDDVSSYHLVYGDRWGSPGSELTFFHWPNSGLAKRGAATISPMAFQVAGIESLEWWSERLRQRGLAPSPVSDRDGRTLISFSDPEGLAIELIAAQLSPQVIPWQESEVPEEHALSGFHGISLTSLRPEATAHLLTDVLNFPPVDQDDHPGAYAGTTAVFETAGVGPGRQIRVNSPAGDWGRVGIGGIHHVALRVPDEATQLAWRARLLERGLQPTAVVDRYYFKSVYFREPGGTLFELATDGPGFATDEPEATLGHRLSLPPFLEGRRAEIESGLPPL